MNRKNFNIYSTDLFMHKLLSHIKIPGLKGVTVIDEE